MRNPLFSLPTYRLTLGLSLATSFVVSCGDTETKKSPVRDIPGVILLDTGEDGNNVPLEDESPPPGFSSYGFWYTYHDIGSCKEAGEPNPDMVAEMFPVQDTDFTTTPYATLGIQPPPEQLPNAPENTRGIRFSGGGQEYFGAGLGFKLEKAYTTNNNQGMDFVAAGIVGFRFWAYSSRSKTSTRRRRPGGACRAVRSRGVWDRRTAKMRPLPATQFPTRLLPSPCPTSRLDQPGSCSTCT